MQLERGNILPLSGDEFHKLMVSVNIGHPRKIAVAVSGGGDSMALTLLLNQWCLNNGIEFYALTVDHGLREASRQEALNVSKWLNDLDIHHAILEWKGKKPISNIQDEARDARYKLLNQWCLSQKIEHLFVAHHKDDQAETFLIRLSRGSGIDGLSAMSEVSLLPIDGLENEKVKLYRPLLSIEKERLIKTLETIDQDWVSDPSNENETYTRVKVRKLLENTDVEGLNREKLSATAMKMSRVKSLLDQLTDQAESDNVHYNSLGYAELSQNFDHYLHEEISLRLLSRLLKKISGSKHPVRYQKLLNLFENMGKEDFSGQSLSGVIIYKDNQEQFLFIREAASIKDDNFITDKKQLLWDNRFVINTLEHTGKIMVLSNEIKTNLLERNPELKEDIYKNFQSYVLRDKLLPTLPIILTKDQKIILPDVLFSKIKQNSIDTFSASFKHSRL